MFPMAIVTGLAALTAALLWLATKRGSKPKDAADGTRRANHLARLAAPVLATTGGILWAISFVYLFFASTYTQDVGESNVRISWTGSLQGQTTEAGLHFLAPWDHISTWDVRNTTVSFVGNGSGNSDTSETNINGPEVSFTDSNNTTGNMDVVVRYSLDPNAVLDLYTDFRTQDVFTTKVIENELRGQVRVISPTRTTDEMLQKRGEFEDLLTAALRTQWDDEGVIIEQVTVRSVTYSSDVMARYDEAQQARIKITTAEADQKAALVQADTARQIAEIDAQRAVITAQGVADANAILTASLTPAILQQMYINALQAGTVYVVPAGSTPFIGTK